MAIHLNQNESILIVSGPHWTSYFKNLVWSTVRMSILSLIFACIYVYYKMNEYCIWFFIAGVALEFFNLLFIYIRHICRLYIVTNERLYIEMGVFQKNKIDIPIYKINEVEVKQTFFKRIFGAGDLVISTGNDKFITLSNISNVDKVKNHISEESKKDLESSQLKNH